MKTYANENDPSAAHWLSRIPIHIDHIDDRSIKDVEGKGLDGFTQCHFFAGIGGWPLALEMASWPDDAPVWTGSCPCQPFSGAGKRKGTADERHLWPEFLRLIAKCKPPTIFGEQVASKAGRDWLATVRTDLEALGYAVGAADLCAASVGAPHIRQRLYWVADSTSERGRGRAADTEESAGRASVEVGSGLGDTNRQQDIATEQGQRLPSKGRDFMPGGRNGSEQARTVGVEAHRLADTGHDRSWCVRRPASKDSTERSLQAVQSSGRSKGGFWDDAEYIPCRDGKARPAKPGIRCLDDGIPGRVAQLRGLGNAIVPQVAATFIAAFMESREIQVTA